jgi:pimeloyl-ACP methyl ester carboxylesterase
LEKRFVNVDPDCICYVEAGKGPPLILIHGFLVSHKDWLPALPLLAERFRVIAVDLPGHGDSGRPSPAVVRYDANHLASCVRGAMQALGVERATVVGHSTGAKIAATLAAQWPQAVERLVLADAQGLPQPLPLLGKLLTLPGLGRPLFRNLYTRATIRMYFKGDVFRDPRHVTDELVDEVWRCFSLPGSKDALYAIFQRTIRPDPLFGDQVLRRITCPVRLLWGEFDKIYPLALADTFRQFLPQATLGVLKGVGHAIPVEAPTETAREIIEFCAPVHAASVSA